jgi:DNA-binding response OmpR family regulator
VSARAKEDEDKPPRGRVPWTGAITSRRLVTQRQLLQEVWGPSYETESNYLRVYLAQLRRKLEPEPSRPRYLLTEPGMGYRFQD